MKSILLILSSVLLLLTSGCAATSAAKVMKALGNDPASLSISVNGWGTVIQIHRANPVVGMSSKISPDGTLDVQTAGVDQPPGTVARAGTVVTAAPAPAAKSAPVPARPNHPSYR